MSKINLKNILKKTFKKKPKKKTGKMIKKNVIKAKKIISKKPKKNVKQIKSLRKKVDEKSTVKSDNLRIPKSNEAKPEIKKVKKQQTEKKEYKIKDFVVYPKHGVCKITDFKKISIGGIDVDCYVLAYDKDKATGYCPVNKQSHLRPLASINQVNKRISILKSKPKVKRSM